LRDINPHNEQNIKRTSECPRISDENSTKQARCAAFHGAENAYNEETSQKIIGNE